jgi:uncharacterized protein (DUF1330 family)
MAFERLVGLHVSDPEGYARYREGMGPVLRRYGGGFRYDFEVAETLRSESDHPINRVFVIGCPDRETMERFFQDPEYLRVRARWFDGSVTGHTTIAAYER